MIDRSQNIYKYILFRSINSMQVLLIVVHRFEFLVKLVKINVDIWKIVVQHQTVIPMLLLISLYALYVLVKKILNQNNKSMQKIVLIHKINERICLNWWYFINCSTFLSLSVEFCSLGFRFRFIKSDATLSLFYFLIKSFLLLEY
jgi:hypothetical protein